MDSQQHHLPEFPIKLKHARTEHTSACRFPNGSLRWPIPDLAENGSLFVWPVTPFWAIVQKGKKKGSPKAASPLFKANEVY